ncbi:MAG: hypothetical protein JWO44_2365 [Bacteroidetes bacterium]|nr:hypothetical protein [Bacteroidota bacterium]
MRLRTKLTVIAGLICAAAAQAQVTTDFAYKKATWDPNPKLHQLNDKEKESNYVILKDKILIEFAYEASGQLVEYSTRHTIIHFNNEKGIEEMNKIYVSYTNILEEMDLKGRTITSEGKIIPLSKSSVKKVDNIENAGSFLIFAMEGIDKGGEIEYMYTNKKSASTNSSWTLQTEIIHKDVSVDIYSPENLVYEGKGYNGFPQFTKDTSIAEKNHISSSVAYIDGMTEEKYSAYDANKMRFDYQLTYNTAKGKARLYSWEYCGTDLYAAIFNFQKGELKAMDKLISKLGVNSMKTDEEKIRAVEMFMKTNINMTGENVPIDKMLDVKYGDDFAMQRLYVGVAKALGMPVEVVLTTDRMNRKFDSNFPSWNNLREYLLYFPAIDKYLSCSNYSSRLGFPPPELTNNKGLFIKETELGDLKTGISKIKSIEAPVYTNSYNNLTESVVFNSETFTPTINIKQEYMGYPAYYIQPAVFYMEAAQKTELMDNLSKFIGKETIVKSNKSSGTDKAEILSKPFVVESVVETPQLIENAGNKYLFKVGALIGPQEELYQDKARQSDAEITYTHSFGRNIEIKIPQGYKIKNPEDINIKKEYTVGGKVLSSFVSSYTLEGDVLKIKIYEDYEAIVYPKENFEQFRAVINASADFNKVVLILEKA